MMGMGMDHPVKTMTQIDAYDRASGLPAPEGRWMAGDFVQEGGRDVAA